MYNMHEITKAYRQTQHRLLLLDYDGTLVPFESTPEKAKPTPELLQILKKLSDDKNNKVVIISGRDHETLETWLGHLPLDFASEHGLWLKENGGDWHLLHDQDREWKKEIKVILDEFTQKVPGSFVEEKTASFAWHYRSAKDQTLADRIKPLIINRLEPLAETYDLALLKGNNVIDIKLAGVDKGAVAHHWLNRRSWDFILAAGDDTTDEDMFEAMPDSSFTVKIGFGETAANTRLGSVHVFRQLLSNLK